MHGISWDRYLKTDGATLRLPNSWAMANLEETGTSHLNLNWKMWFLYLFLFVILADLQGGIFEMLQINMCFYHPVLHPFFRSWGNAGKRWPFFGALFGRWIFVACQTSGSNASAVLHDPPVAIKPECIALVCHSSRVGACGCCALGGLVPFFFLGVVFFFGGSGVVMLGDFFFLWTKKGYGPPEDEFFRNRTWTSSGIGNDSNFLLLYKLHMGYIK